MIKLRNHLSGEQDIDRLNRKARVDKERKCLDNVCLGSTFGIAGKRNNVDTKCRPPDEVEHDARGFLMQYYESIDKTHTQDFEQRFQQVKNEIAESGTYDLTEAELNFGVRLAWRNAPRCIGRIQWRNIKVLDERKISTAREVFDAICRHLEYTNNGGNIRTTITVFPVRRQGKPDFRIWNHFIIGYAGYENPDGTILGHSINKELTNICLKLGWKSPEPKTKFDVLPLVVSANGNDPELFIIPPELIMEVHLEHPEYPWFKDMGIRFYTLPFLAAMLFDCGGLQFPAAPFNAWFTAPEIASRELGDVDRYNYLPEVATRMGLRTDTLTSLWKDKAMVEMNVAVLHSFQKAGVTIIDHHTVAEQFMSHLETEKRERGGCPADWAWIVPPISGSTVPVFHQEMALYFLKPSFEYQAQAWKVHTWKNPNILGSTQTTVKRLSLKEIALGVAFCSMLFGKRLRARPVATILYATETGKSRKFAQKLESVLKNSFHAKTYQMDQYDLSQLHQKSLLFVITSTFGNGDPPANGEPLDKYLAKLKSQRKAADNKHEFPLTQLRFAVFALGSSAYPNICAFGRNLDYNFNLLGGQRLLSVPCGDELEGQEVTFQSWCVDAYKAACDAYALKPETIEAKEQVVPAIPTGNFRLQAALSTAAESSGVQLPRYEQLHGRKLAFYSLMQRDQLHEPLDDVQTIRIVLEAPSSDEVPPFAYHVGDHIGILPQNHPELVTGLLSKLKNKPEGHDTQVELQFRSHGGQWTATERLPICSLRELFGNVLDFTTPPSQEMLSYLASVATNEPDGEALQKLSNDGSLYDSWKRAYQPNLLTVLKWHPSCSPDAAAICTLLPILQPRYYSVSSSSKVFPNQFHLTIGVVKYTPNGHAEANYGVCSNYLNRLNIGSKVMCFVRNTSSSTFRLPQDTGRSIILVGPGTGIAPFRGFWQERNFLRKEGGRELGKLSLFFGCRSKEMLLYGSEIEQMQKDEVITNYFVAFSREKHQKKTYVQDLILEHKDQIVREVVDENAIIYICGDAVMAEDVFRTLQTLIKEALSLSDEEAIDFMRQLKETDRCHMDIFGQTHKRGKKPPSG